MTNGAQKQPPSVPIQSVVIQQSQQDQTATPNVILVQAPSKNPIAIISFVCGVLSFLFVGYTIELDEYDACLYIWFIGLLAVIFGHIGAAEASKTGIGKGFAVTGLILGYMTLLAYVAGVFVVLSILQSLGN